MCPQWSVYLLRGSTGRSDSGTLSSLWSLVLNGPIADPWGFWAPSLPQLHNCTFNTGLTSLSGPDYVFPNTLPSRSLKCTTEVTYVTFYLFFKLLKNAISFLLPPFYREVSDPYFLRLLQETAH